MKTINKTFLFLVLMSISTAIFSQNNREEIILNYSYNIEEPDLTGDNNNRRDVDVYSLLPVVMYDAGSKELIINSPHISLENIPYYIMDSTDSIVQLGLLFLQKDLEETIVLTTQTAGVYVIAIEIDGMLYSGEFEIE